MIINTHPDLPNRQPRMESLRVCSASRIQFDAVVHLAAVNDNVIVMCQISDLSVYIKLDATVIYTTRMPVRKHARGNHRLKESEIAREKRRSKVALAPVST